MIFVKIQPYVQFTLAPRSNQKLAYKFFGLFPVLARIGSVAYKLQLPASLSVHPVFHVSQLKKAVTSGVQVSASFPIDINLPRVPEAILQRRIVSDGTGSVEQGLINWADWPEDMATWEALDHLRQVFPRAPAWGQADSQTPGSVTTTTIARPTGEAHGPRKGERVCKPNVKTTGLEWV